VLCMLQHEPLAAATAGTSCMEVLARASGHGGSVRTSRR
jgi:hypothetical protein